MCIPAAGKYYESLADTALPHCLAIHPLSFPFRSITNDHNKAVIRPGSYFDGPRWGVGVEGALPGGCMYEPNWDVGRGQAGFRCSAAASVRLKDWSACFGPGTAGLVPSDLLAVTCRDIRDAPLAQRREQLAADGILR